MGNLLDYVQPVKLFNKTVLSEEFISVHKISKNLLIDPKKILRYIKKCVKTGVRFRPEVWYSDNNYFKLDAFQHITWLSDYLRDSYKTEDEEGTLVINHVSAIHLDLNESLGSHNHIDEWNYEGSPDVSMLYCVDTGKEPCDLIFEYEYGRHKKRRWAVTLSKGTCVIFPSYLNHFITQNINKKPFVALSLRYQKQYN